MKISCLQKNLNLGIAIVERAITKNSTLPILENVLLKIDQGRLQISATNLELAIMTKIGGKVRQSGQITVPSRVFSQFISSLATHRVDLLAKGNTLFVSSEKTRVKIKGLPAKDFPLIPEVEERHKFVVSAPIIKRALYQVVGSASVSEARPEMSGVFITGEDQTLRIVATDSYRLAEKKIHLKTKLESPCSFLLPIKTAQEVVRILTEREGEVVFILDDTQVKIIFSGIEIVSRLIDGNFPDYEQIIPQSFKTQAIVKLNDFISQIKIASLFSGRVDDVRLSFSGGAGKKSVLLVSSASSEIGSQSSDLPIRFSTSGSGKVVLNHRYLLEGLGQILSDQVLFSLNQGSTPVLLTPFSEAKRPKDKDFRYVIMPLKK